MKRFLPLACSFLLFAPSLTAQEENEIKWTTRNYQFPAYELIRGFTSPERGFLKAPSLPGPEATEEQIQEFIQKSNQIVSHYLKIQGLALPKGALLVFDPETMTLATRVPHEGQAGIEFMARSLSRNVQSYVLHELHVIEAEAANVRAIVERAGEDPDHTALLDELLEQVDAGNGRIVTTSRIEARSGQRAKSRQAQTVPIAFGIAIDDKERVLYDTQVIEVGTVWETDPVIGADRESIDLNLSFEHHFGPVEKRQETVTKQAQSAISAVTTDTYNAIIVGSITLKDGMTKMLGTWRPDHQAAGDVLQSAFVSGRVVSVMPRPNDRLTQWLNAEGENVLPIPPGEPEFETAEGELPPGMIVRRFQIPPNFLSMGGDSSGADDPFADLGGGAEPTFTVQATAQDILESQGVPFPEGASANYLMTSSELVVRNTPENMKLVEAYVGSILGPDYPKTIGIAVHIVQADATLIRQLAEQSRSWAEHEPAWQALKGAAEQGNAKILQSFWLEGRSGQRSKVEAGKLHRYYSGAELNTAEKEEPHTSATLELMQDTNRVGTELEIDPVIGADGITLDLNVSLNYDYAPPTRSDLEPGEEGQVQLDAPGTTFHEVEIQSSMTLRDGMIRMLGIWKPEGTPGLENQDVLQAAFLRAEILRISPDAE